MNVRVRAVPGRKGVWRMFFLERTVFAPPAWSAFSWRAVRPLRALRPGVFALRIDCGTSTSPLKEMGRELSIASRGQPATLTPSLTLVESGSHANRNPRVN